MTWVVKSLLFQARSQMIASAMESKNQGMWKKVWSLYQSTFYRDLSYIMFSQDTVLLLTMFVL